MSPADDAFFRENMYSNYGDLAAAIGGMLDEYSSLQGGVSAKMSSIEDMQR